ncbi:MAG: hypothetical protein RMJ98_21715, partial [Myxococcales bacterium]|nr:aspartate kinase [Polyangiaceae bacterium]MDW8251922.1 hypothetical protein [Myxococcales bacterium]
SGGTFLIPLLNVPDWPRARTALLTAVGPSLSLQEGLCTVSVVGDGLSTTGHPLVDFLQALRSAEAHCYGVYGTALRLTALLDSDASSRAQQALHARFCA